jgi:hypothetical protein
MLSHQGFFHNKDDSIFVMMMMASKTLLLTLLTLTSIIGFGQTRVIESRWVNSEIMFISTDPITFEQDTVIFVPKREWFCGGVLHFKNRSNLLGITWHGDLSNYNIPIADHEIGLMFGRLIKRNNSVRGLMEMEVRRSFSYQVFSAQLGYHHTVLSKKIYHNSKVPRVLLGGKLGYYHFNQNPQFSFAPSLSIVSPYGRFITNIAYQFNHGLRQNREMANGFKIGVNLLLSNHRFID